MADSLLPLNSSVRVEYCGRGSSFAIPSEGQWKSFISAISTRRKDRGLPLGYAGVLTRVDLHMLLMQRAPGSID